LLTSLFIVTGFLAGVYPALYLSGFPPVQVIKGNVSLFGNAGKGSSKSILRKSLVTVQFCISALLLTGTVYVANQVHYMNTKDLGFDKRDLIICNVYGPAEKGSFESLRHQLLNNPDIINATVSLNIPFHGDWGKEINWEGATAADKMEILYNQIDYAFIDTYKMNIVHGRNFSRQFSTDGQACLINETACKALPWQDPLGKKIDNNRFTIIGVVKDFHPFSVHEKIPSFYMVLNSGTLSDGGIFTIRVRSGDREKTAAFICQEFRNFFPNAIIEVTSFDSDLNLGTKGIWETIKKIFTGFAIISILIAANGLFGMISFAAQRRMKEIGVRKIFGADSLHLYLTMSKEFAVVLLFSALAAYPAGYLLATTTPGAYKYQMQFTDYFLVIGLMIVTAVAATAYHTTKAVLSDPVEVLRYE
jgi:putative ABC transport system permease protein